MKRLGILSNLTPQTPGTPAAADWRFRAACADAPTLFFPPGTDAKSQAMERAALTICGRCPVIATCRQWALDTRQQYGVWGGMTEQERAAWRRRGSKDAKPRNPIIVYGSFRQAYDACTVPVNGHLKWVGGNEVKVDGRRYSPNKAAWLATRSAAPVGRVFTDCDHSGCVLHLNDQAMRDARKAAPTVRPEAECGTRAGYRGHLKRGEATCQPCRDANADGDRRLRNTGTSKALTPERSAA